MAQDDYSDAPDAGEDQNNNNSRRGWHGDSEGHAEAGSIGGRKVSQDREHMARIGRKGGLSVSQNREHMSNIGRRGGASRRNPDYQSDDDE